MFFLSPITGNGGRVFFSGNRELLLIPENVFLLQSLNLSGIGSWNVPAWSISAEFWTYLAFAIAMVLGLVGRITFLVIGLLVSPLLIFIFANGSIALEADGGIIRCLMGFCVGVVLQKFWRKRKPGGFLRTILLELSVMIAVVAFVILAPSLKLELLAPLIFAAAVWVYSNDHGPIARILQWRGFILIGMLSYSLYMTHTFVHARVKNMGILYQNATDIRVFDDDALKFFGANLWMGDLFLLVCVSISLLVSFVTFRWIEAPGQAIGRRFVVGANVRARNV